MPANYGFTYVQCTSCGKQHRIRGSADYNTKSIIGKIVALIENNEKIIEYEEKNNVDIFNYYKNMQKNKEFLMLGKLYTPGHTSNITVTTRGNNQLCLLKKSRMNTDVSNNT